MGPATDEFRFERITVQPGSRNLLVDGQPAKLGSRAFDMLLTLIERRDRVVPKNELLDLVWPGVHVEEGNLQVHMVALRKLLGPQAIATIPGRGYRFAAALDGPERQAPAPAPQAPQGGGFLGNISAAPPTLHGREADRANLADMIERHRLVSVVGPAGIGKTRVAQAVAHARRGRDRDGGWTIELAPLDSPELVAPTVARVLGHALGPRDGALDSLAESMRGQKLLLVLDNCEHLVGEVRALAKALLDRAPGVRLLVTSQQPLRLPEEQVYRLGSLQVPEGADLEAARLCGAVALFAERAGAADSRFALSDENLGAVVEICARLDGVALAIELAAARVSLLGVEAVRRRLNERLRLFASADRAALPRHRTLLAALEWSYGLLSDHERRVLNRLGVFVGGFSLEGAQRVAADAHIDPWEALECLSSLVDKSLVMVEPGEPPRYQLLETTRAFALERLAAAGETQAMRRRHAQAIVETFRAAGMIEGPSARIARTAPELDNFRAAAAWATGPDGDRAVAVELAGEADFIWFSRGFNDEGVTLWSRVEPWVDAATPPAVAARFWLTRSILVTLNALKQQAAAAEKAAGLYRGIGDDEGLFFALIYLAVQRALMGHGPAAERALEEARRLLRPSWPAWTAARVEFVLGYIAFYCKLQPEGAALCIGRSRALTARGGGDEGFDAEAEMGGVLVALALRRYADAARGAKELLGRPLPSVVGYFRAIIALVLAAALAGLGDLAASEGIFRQALPSIKRATGTVAWALNYVSFLVARQGRHDAAARLIGFLDASRGDDMVVRSPAQRAPYDEAAALCAAALGSDGFARLKAAGAKLSEDEATALALPPR